MKSSTTKTIKASRYTELVQDQIDLSDDFIVEQEHKSWYKKEKKNELHFLINLILVFKKAIFIINCF